MHPHARTLQVTNNAGMSRQTGKRVPQLRVFQFRVRLAGKGEIADKQRGDRGRSFARHIEFPFAMKRVLLLKKVITIARNRSIQEREEEIDNPEFGKLTGKAKKTKKAIKRENEIEVFSIMSLSLFKYSLKMKNKMKTRQEGRSGVGECASAIHGAHRIVASCLRQFLRKENKNGFQL